MDTTRILEAYPRLEEHMRSSGYSDGYVRKLGECLRRILPMMPGWECWDDASSWADGIPGDGARPYLRPYVVILRRFYERGALPRSSQSGRHMRENAYDLLCDGFRAVCDEYSSSEAASSKKPTTVRNEVLNAAAFLRKLESLGCEGPGDVTEEDVLRVLTDEDGLPVYSWVRNLRIQESSWDACPNELLPVFLQPLGSLEGRPLLRLLDLPRTAARLMRNPEHPPTNVYPTPPQGLPAMRAGIGFRRLWPEPELLRVLGGEHSHAILSRARARTFLSYLHFRILPFLLGDTVSGEMGHDVIRTGLLG